MKIIENNQDNNEKKLEGDSVENETNNVEVEIDRELGKIANNFSNVQKEVEALGDADATDKALENYDEEKKAKLSKIVKKIAIGAGVMLFIAANSVDPSVIKDVEDFISRPDVTITTIALISFIGLVGASISTIRHKMETRGMSTKDAIKEYFHPSSVDSANDDE